MERPRFEGQPDEVRLNSTAYSPSSAARIRRLIRRSGIDQRTFHFVDLGTGKGRPLIVASSYPFLSIVGVEADPSLCDIARNNVRTWTSKHAGPSIRIVESDARVAHFPEGNLFVFMHNPFVGDVLDAVAERLAELTDSAREVVVAYSGDENCAALERTGAFSRVRLTPLRPWLPSTMSLFFSSASKQKRA